MASTLLVWFDGDLRLADHAALYHAVDRADAVVPVFVWDPDGQGDAAPGAAKRWWLHHHLASLDAALREKGSRLILRRGDAAEVLAELAEATGAEALYWNERFTPALRRRDAQVREALADTLEIQTFDGRLLHEPEAVRTTTDGPYHVFTPFWKRLRAELRVPDPYPRPRMGERLAPASWPRSDSLDALGLLPAHDWTAEMAAFWTPGEDAAHRRLAAFLDDGLLDYDAHRDVPAVDGTARLSPYLAHGALSPRQVWQAVEGWVANGAMREAADAFLRQLAWREFSYHLLHHYPETVAQPLKDKFEAFEWAADADRLRRWQRGQTGYPIVDAGMRQLWALGWMHNRLRLLTGSFLTKDLLQPWQDGAAWFWDTLVDADQANNTMGWQWVAGSGADAQPFFRIFNPVTQSRRYDPDGTFLRRWLPELADLPDKHLHAPWEAPADVLRAAGVTLGDTYPEPLVDHADARAQALAAYQAIR